MNRRSLLTLLAILPFLGLERLCAWLARQESLEELLKRKYLGHMVVAVTKEDAVSHLFSISESTFPRWAGRQNGKTELAAACLEHAVAEIERRGQGLIWRVS